MSGVNVLLVDDEPHVIRVMKRALQRSGCNVREAGNGEMAISCLQAEQPDIMVTDIDMPKMNGRDLCLWIDENLPERGFQIIVLTARAEAEHREWSAAIDNLHFMEKPVSMRALKSVIDNLGSGASQ